MFWTAVWYLLFKPTIRRLVSIALVLAEGHHPLTGVYWVMGLQYGLMFSQNFIFLVLFPLTVLWRSRQDYYELWSSRQPQVRAGPPTNIAPCLAGKTIRAVPLSPRAPAQAASPHHRLVCLEKTNHMCSSGSIDQLICLCLKQCTLSCFIQIWRNPTLIKYVYSFHCKVCHSRSTVLH